MYYKLGQACVTTWAGLFYYKSGQTLLQIGTASLLQIRASVVTIGAAITYYGNHYYKIGQLLQIGLKCIKKWGRYYKLGQLLQTGA